MKDMVTTQIKKRAYAPEHTSKWLMHWDYQVGYPAVYHSMRLQCTRAFPCVLPGVWGVRVVATARETQSTHYCQRAEGSWPHVNAR
jgi:hypothetical protein